MYILSSKSFLREYAVYIFSLQGKFCYVDSPPPSPPITLSSRRLEQPSRQTGFEKGVRVRWREGGGGLKLPEKV